MRWTAWLWPGRSGTRRDEEAADENGWLFREPPNVAVFTTRSIVERGAWIAHVSHSAEDGSWDFHDNEPGAPPEEEAMLVSLRNMVDRDGTLRALADLPEGWRAWRDGPAAAWRRGRAG